MLLQINIPKYITIIFIIYFNIVYIVVYWISTNVSIVFIFLFFSSNCDQIIQQQQRRKYQLILNKNIRRKKKSEWEQILFKIEIENINLSKYKIIIYSIFHLINRVCNSFKEKCKENI